MPGQLNIAVFASGRGSNFKAILDAINAGRIHNAKIVLVYSNNADSGALRTAKENKLPALHLNRKASGSEAAFTAKLLQELHHYQTNFIVLAGYMKKIDPTIIRIFRNRIVNIHPALLPAFGGKGMYGTHVHEAVLASGATQSGATVHLVDEEYDHGRILLQKSVPVVSGDTADSLAERVLSAEHELYPEAIRLIADGQLSLDEEQVPSSASR